MECFHLQYTSPSFHDASPSFPFHHHLFLQNLADYFHFQANTSRLLLPSLLPANFQRFLLTFSRVLFLFFSRIMSDFFIIIIFPSSCFSSHPSSSSLSRLSKQSFSSLYTNFQALPAFHSSRPSRPRQTHQTLFHIFPEAEGTL